MSLMSNVSHQMYSCPHCNRNSIGIMSKWLSFPALPALCKLCGNPSFLPSSKSSQLLVFNCFLLTLAGFASIYWHSVLPLAAAGVAALILWVFGLHRRQLAPVSPEQIRLARQSEGLGVLFLLWLTGSQ
jgi:hypothetical protein